MPIERPASKQPMPPEAKRVFKGHIFDVYQWEQKLFDGTTATFERVKRSDTVVVIPVTADKRIVMVDQEQPGRPPFVDFPGGRIEEGEEPDVAARRELQEETGYTTDQELVLWYATQPVGKVDWAIYVFVARDCAQTAPQNLDAGEKISAKLLNFEEVVDTILELPTFSDELTVRFLKAKHDPAEMEKIKKLFGII